MLTEAASTEVIDGETIPLFDPSKGKDELNLAELPLTLPEALRRSLNGQGVRTHRFQMSSRNHRELEAADDEFVEIIPGAKHGFPGPYDARVMVALISIAKWKNNFSSPDVSFTLRMLLDVLQVAPSGQSYRRARESIERLKQTTYGLNYVWYTKATGARELVKQFSVLDEIDLDLKDGENDCQVTFGKRLFNSLQGETIRTIDLAVYNAFRSELAAEAYRYLGKVLYREPFFTVDLQEFCYCIGMAKYTNSKGHWDVGQVKRALTRPLVELEDAGVIAPRTIKERVRRLRPGKYEIVFERPGGKRKAIQQPELFDSSPISQLVDRGVTAATAAKLVANSRLDEKQLNRLIAFVDTLHAKSPKDSLPAYLNGVIARGAEAPASFKTPEELEAERKQVQAIRREKDQAKREAALAKKQAEKEAAKRKAAQWNRVTAYVDALPDREAFIEQAIAAQPTGIMQDYARRYVAGERDGFAQHAYELALTEATLPKLADEAAA